MQEGVARSGSRWVRALWPLVLADLRHRYGGAPSAAAWSLLVPLVEVAAYAALFGLVLRPSGGSGFAASLAVGVLAWGALRESLEGAATALRDNRWVRRSSVPMDLLVARQVAASLPRIVLALVVAYAALAFRPRPPGAAFLLPLVAVGLQLAASQGLGLALAPLAVLRPGARAVLASALTLLTFASPIVYPEEMLGSAALRAIEWNPFTSALRLYRSPLGSAPTLGDVAFVAAFAAACLGAGAFVKGRLYWPARDRL